MTLNRNSFLEYLRKSLFGIKRKMDSRMLTGSDCFFFNDGFLYSFSGNVMVTIKVGEEFKELNGIIQAQDFYAIISKFKEETIDIEVMEKIWNLKCGKAKAEIPLMDYKSTLEYFIKQNVLLLNKKEISGNLEEDIKFCYIKDNNLTSMSGIYIDNDSIYSCDTKVFIWKKLNYEIDSFWMDNTMISELLKFGGIKFIYLEKTWIHFYSSENECISFPRLLDKTYPVDSLKSKLKSLMCKEEKDIFGVLSKDLLNIIDRASILGSSVAISSNKEDIIVKLHFERNMITVFSEKSTGKYEESILWLIGENSNFESFDIFVTYDMMSYSLDRMDKFFVKVVSIGEDKFHKILTFCRDTADAICIIIPFMNENKSEGNKKKKKEQLDKEMQLENESGIIE